MASALYPIGKGAFMGADIDIDNDTIKLALVADAYTYSAAHDFWNDVSSNVVGTPATLTISRTDNVVDATDVTYTSVSGADIGALVMYKDTGDPATSPLIAFIDIATVSPNGGDINVNFDNGANKIFAL